MTKHTQQGFTLLELLITIAIVGITMAIAIPSMGEFIKNDRLTSFRNTLHIDLMLAKSKAVERNQQVIVCASSNGATCSGDFSQGWIVAVDTNNSGAIDNTDEQLKVQTAITGDISFNAGALSSITYDSRGFTPNSIGTISVCDDRGASHARTISISRTGRISNGASPSC